MDAPALTPERTRELAELRHRAYGPGAEFPLDDEARARLEELEAQVRALSRAHEPRDPPRAEAAAAVTGGSDPSTSRTSSDPGAPGAASVVSVPPGAGDEVPARSWWRRLPVWAVVAVAAVIAAVAFSAGALLPSRADATLRVVADVSSDEVEPQQMLQWFSVDLDSLRRHDDFHGVKVWSATDERGSRCLMYSYRDWADGRCTPAPIDPTLDLMIYPGMSPLEGLELPDGSVVRLVLRDDVVDVTVAEVESDARHSSSSRSASDPSRA